MAPVGGRTALPARGPAGQSAPDAPQEDAVMLTSHPLDQSVQATAHMRVVDIHGYNTLRRAATLLADNQIGMLVVRRGALAVGVIGERDIVRAVAEGADVDDVRVDEIMTEDIAGVQADASLRDAVAIMVRNSIRHLLVRDEGHVRGVLSARDVLAALPQDAPA